MVSLAIDVVFENGVFRPLRPISLPEGSRARVYTADPGAPLVTKTLGVCGGRACVAGTRISVWGLVSYRNQGLDAEGILVAVPSITREQLVAAFQYADENAAEIARDIAENEADE